MAVLLNDAANQIAKTGFTYDLDGNLPAAGPSPTSTTRVGLFAANLDFTIMDRGRGVALGIVFNPWTPDFFGWEGFEGGWGFKGYFVAFYTVLPKE